MQTLWTRVAQVRGACRCPQCAPSVQGVSRRATASATRRMPRYFTSSTLFYSGIFASAATFDAGVKKQRREKWDQAIAEVKHELEQPAAERQEQKEEFDLQTEDGLEDEPVVFKPFASEDHLDEFQYTDGETTAEWPANTGAPLDRFLAPNSIYGRAKRRSSSELLTWTPKKFATVQTSMDILLLKLMEDSYDQNSHHVGADWLSEELEMADLQSPDEISTRIKEKVQRLKMVQRADKLMTYHTSSEAPEAQLPIPSDKRPLCQYNEDDELRFQSIQRDLNFSLQRLFRLHAGEQISWPSMIGRIIYNLRCSSAPPNVDTYNILLLGFDQAGARVPCMEVLRSFRRCHMRPNEITLATIFNHFTKTDDPVNFAHWIEMARGRRGGLALARPDVEIHEENKRLMHNPKHPERIIQLPHHNPLVFGAMIAGVLKFAGFEPALQICQDMGQEGWGLCIAGLTPLLQDCVRRSDWNAGMVVWQQIEALKAQSRRREDSRWVTERIRLDTFAAMLRLCLKCDRRDDFYEIWNRALRSHHGATARLRQLIKGSGRMRTGDVVDESIAKAARYRVKREVETSLERRVRSRREMRRLEEEKRRPRELEQARTEQEHFGPQPTVNALSEYLDLKEHSNREEQTFLAQRLVLVNDEISADLSREEPFPRHQSTWRFETPNRHFEASGAGQGLPDFPRRLVLPNEDVLADLGESEVFPLHQSLVYRLPPEQAVDADTLGERQPDYSQRPLSQDEHWLAHGLYYEAFPQHQSSMSFRRRMPFDRRIRGTQIRTASPAESPAPVVAPQQSAQIDMVKYFEFAELDDPDDVPHSRDATRAPAMNDSLGTQASKWNVAEGIPGPIQRANILHKEKKPVKKADLSSDGAVPPSKVSSRTHESPGSKNVQTTAVRSSASSREDVKASDEQQQKSFTIRKHAVGGLQNWTMDKHWTKDDLNVKRFYIKPGRDKSLHGLADEKSERAESLRA